MHPLGRLVPTSKSVKKVCHARFLWPHPTIDLGDKEFKVEQLADEILADCLGCKGLATLLLLERNPIGVDPLAPENHLIINTGPVPNALLPVRVWPRSVPDAIRT